MAVSFEPILIESSLFPGYYHIPLENCDTLISKDCQFLNPDRSLIRKLTLSKKGYLTVSLRYGNPKRYGTFASHRLLALLFVPKPARHHDKSYAELQVNHIDGDKQNNALSNLEWVTGEENMDHGRETGLFENQLSVLARNLVTGEMLRFRSVSLCAKWLCVNANRLHIHLNSVCAGMIEKDDWVVKFDNGMAWPRLLPYNRDITTLHHVADVVAENVETGEKLLCNNLLQAIRTSGFSRNQVMNHRARKGHDAPYHGWIFYPLKN